MPALAGEVREVNRRAAQNPDDYCLRGSVQHPRYLFAAEVVTA
jgi:hypothetical protein